MIREMHAEDRQIYFEMSRQFYDSGAAIRKIDDKTRETFWQIILKRQLVQAFLFEYKGEPAGYALTVPYASQEFGGIVQWIDELFVLPQYRGHGLGKDFLKFAEDHFPSVLLRLEVEPDNERAVRIYRSSGFQPLPYLQMIKTKTRL